MKNLLLLFIPLIFFFGCEPNEDDEQSSTLYNCYGDGCVEAEDGQYNSLNDCVMSCDCDCGVVTNVDYSPPFNGYMVQDPVSGGFIVTGAHPGYFTYTVENNCLNCNGLTYSGQGCGLADNPPSIGDIECLEFTYSEWVPDVASFNESTGQIEESDMCVSLDDYNIISGPFFSSLAENCIEEIECTNNICFNCTPDGCVEAESGNYSSFEECEAICNCSCGQVIGGSAYPGFPGYLIPDGSGGFVVDGEHPGYSIFSLRNYCTNEMMSTCEDVSLGDTFCGPDATQYTVSCEWTNDIPCINSGGYAEIYDGLVQTELIDGQEIITLYTPFNGILFEPNMPCP